LRTDQSIILDNLNQVEELGLEEDRLVPIVLRKRKRVLEVDDEDGQINIE